MAERVPDRVLMIEDDHRLAAMVSEYLAAAGLEVTVAPSGGRGLELVGGGRFRAVLLDVVLPDMDGFDVCRRIRATGSDIPVLMLSARGELPGRRPDQPMAPPVPDGSFASGRPYRIRSAPKMAR